MESLRSLKQRMKKKMLQPPEEENIMVANPYEKAELCATMIRKKTGIIFEDTMALHSCEWDQGYPENPHRYACIMDRLKALKLIERCEVLNKPGGYCAKDTHILAKHTVELYKQLAGLAGCSDYRKLEQLAEQYDAIYFNKDTFQAALIAAGSAIRLVEEICTGRVQNGMAIIRPPGHHAMENEYCGYCYFNNVAIAAQHALDNNYANKILIVDYDVHHGQGTQRMFYNEDRVLYFSIHRYEYGTFWPNLKESNSSYIGEGKGKGFNINVPLNTTGLSDLDYFAIVTHILLPVAYEFQPDLILVSAGYDASIGCPEGEMLVSPGFYGQLMVLLSGLAMGRIAVCLEGGYFPPSLAEGVALTLLGLLDDTPATLNLDSVLHVKVIEVINDLKFFLHEFWDCFKVIPLLPLQGEANKHSVVVRYLGNPPQPPYETRNCYPVQDTETIEKNTAKIIELQNDYSRIKPHKVGYAFSSDAVLHESTKYCPENPERLIASYAHFCELGLDKRCTLVHNASLLLLKMYLVNQVIIFQQRQWDLLALMNRVHDEDYLRQLFTNQFNVILNDCGSLITDMYYNSNTLQSIKSAVSCTLELVDSVLEGAVSSGVAFIRPPGHHAERSTPGGFCYVNNVAIAAQYLVDRNIERILIVDFDIHHGNGTQKLFYDSNKVLFLSMHRYENGKFFPSSNEASSSKTGEGLGCGYNVNVALNAEKMGNADYMYMFHSVVLPIALSYKPEVVLVSAGFDSGINDCLGNYTVTPDAFGHFIQMLKPLANGKIIVVLEGGYNVTTTKLGINICIKTLLGDPLPLMDIGKLHQECYKSVQETIAAHSAHCQVLQANRALPDDVTSR